MPSAAAHRARRARADGPRGAAAGERVQAGGGPRRSTCFPRGGAPRARSRTRTATAMTQVEKRVLSPSASSRAGGPTRRAWSCSADRPQARAARGRRAAARLTVAAARVCSRRASSAGDGARSRPGAAARATAASAGCAATSSPASCSPPTCCPPAIGDASLAGLPPEAGLYSCLFAGLVFWLFCSSRHTAVTVTSAISLLVGASLAELAGGDPARHAALAAATALLVAALGLAAWLAPGGQPRELHLRDRDDRLQDRRRPASREHAAAEALRLQGQPRRLLGADGPLPLAPRRDEPRLARARRRRARSC